ncbi:MAG: hypothetical protein WED12_08010 [Chloroflexota bacterium]
MSTDRDVTRIVRSWLDEGVTVLPDRVLDAVLDQLPATPQRRAGWLARRSPVMRNSVRIAIAAAAVVVVAIVGYQLLPGSPAPGVETSATPEPTATPSATPSSQPSTAGGLPVGSSFLLADGQPSGNEIGRLAMTVTIPAPGWDGEPDNGILVKNDNPDPPEGSGMIVWAGVDHLYVYGDPCEWSSTRPETPSTTVDEVAAALAAQASRDASAPVDITLDGYAGKAITLHVPDDIAYSAGEFTDCDQGKFGSWSLGTTDLSPHRYAQGPGQIDEVWILDVDGLLVVIDWTHYAGTPPADVDELRAIVESATFEAP